MFRLKQQCCVGVGLSISLLGGARDLHPQPRAGREADFQRYGQIARVSGNVATARKAGAIASLSFALPNDVPAGQVLPGQPGYATADLTVARIARFPIHPPSSNTTVALGLGGGKLIVKTSNVVVSASGTTNGRVLVSSEDLLEGFTGVVWLRVLANDGTPLHAVLAGCWGVNRQTSLTKSWTIQVPTDTALQTRRVELLVGKTGCDQDQFQAASKQLTKAAEATALWVDVPIATGAATSTARKP